MFNQRTITEKHSFLVGDFSLLNGNQYKFTPLQNMDTILVGLNDFKTPRDQLYSQQLSFSNFLGQATFASVSNIPFFNTGFSFLAFEIKLQFIC